MSHWKLRTLRSFRFDLVSPWVCPCPGDHFTPHYESAAVASPPGSANKGADKGRAAEPALHNHLQLVLKANWDEHKWDLGVAEQASTSAAPLLSPSPLRNLSRYRKPHGWKHLRPVIWSSLTPGSRSAFVWYFSWTWQLVAFFHCWTNLKNFFFGLPPHERVSSSLSKGNNVHVLILTRADSVVPCIRLIWGLSWFSID